MEILRGRHNFYFRIPKLDEGSIKDSLEVRNIIELEIEA